MKYLLPTVNPYVIHIQQGIEILVTQQLETHYVQFLLIIFQYFLMTLKTV